MVHKFPRVVAQQRLLWAAPSIRSCAEDDDRQEAARKVHLQQGLQGDLALLHGGLHVKAPSIDDLVGHVDLGLLDGVAHQALHAVPKC